MAKSHPKPLMKHYEKVMRNLHGPVVFLTLVRLAETPMFSRVDWTTVLLRQRNSTTHTVPTKFALPNSGWRTGGTDDKFRDGWPELGLKSHTGSGRKAQMGSSDPTSPRRKASLFNLPGLRARHFSFVLVAQLQQRNFIRRAARFCTAPLSI
jgi:hypothetical protein